MLWLHARLPQKEHLSGLLSLKLRLYKTFVCAAAIWDPAKTHSLSLEFVQNCSARFILQNSRRTSSVSAAKTTLGLLDLTLCGKVSLRLLKELSRLYHRNEVTTLCHLVSIFPTHDVAALEPPSRTIIVGMAEFKGAILDFVSCSD